MKKTDQVSSYGKKQMKKYMAVMLCLLLSMSLTQDNVKAEEIDTTTDAGQEVTGQDVAAAGMPGGSNESTEDSSEITEDTIKDVVLTVGSDASQRNLTWYTKAVSGSAIQITEAENVVDGEIEEESAMTFQSEIEESNSSSYYSNQATISGLSDSTKYAYQIVLWNGEEKTTSQVYYFSTQEEESYNFLLAGDAQLGASHDSVSDGAGWSNTISEALNYFTQPSFLISVGDQVEDGSSESQYDLFTNTSGLTSLTLATAIGNHDTSSDSYSQHFNLPNESSYGTTNAGSDYWYVYGNTLFLVLNTNNASIAEHKAFMEEAIAQNPDVLWKVAVYHHSIYSVARHVSSDEIVSLRTELAPVIDELDIDVVLSGHDHVYARSYMMDGLEAEVETNEDGTALESVIDPEGTLYITVNSSSGSKFYDITSPAYNYCAVSSQEYVPNISNVEITNDSFTITTYRITDDSTDMSVVDQFSIYKTADADQEETDEDDTDAVDQDSDAIDQDNDSTDQDNDSTDQDNDSADQDNESTNQSTGSASQNTGSSNYGSNTETVTDDTTDTTTEDESNVSSEDDTLTTQENPKYVVQNMDITTEVVEGTLDEDGYYYDSDGNKLTTCMVIDSQEKQYVLDEDGIVVKDVMVVTSDHTRYYVTSSGEIARSQRIEFTDGNTYYATKSGKIAVLKVVKLMDGTRYYATKLGAFAKEGIIYLQNGVKYYATETGQLAVKQLVTLSDGKQYYAGENAKLVKSKWVTVGDVSYYCNKSGLITKSKAA